MTDMRKEVLSGMLIGLGYYRKLLRDFAEDGESPEAHNNLEIARENLESAITFIGFALHEED